MTIKDIQQRLKDIGFDPGPIDGLWGPRTANAILLALDSIQIQYKDQEVVIPSEINEPLTQREKDLHPELLRRWLQAKNTWNKARPDREIFITCSYRSPEEQNNLYAQGRTKSGSIVTNARGGQSIHNYKPALALDVAFYMPGKKTLDWSNKLFEDFAKVFKPLGIEWGGDWKSFIDRPHFQAPGAKWQDLQSGKKYVWN